MYSLRDGTNTFGVIKYDFYTHTLEDADVIFFNMRRILLLYC